MESFLYRLQGGPNLHDVDECPLINDRDRDEAEGRLSVEPDRLQGRLAFESLLEGRPAQGDVTTLQIGRLDRDRKSTRLNSSHDQISYAVFCLKKKKKTPFNSCYPLLPPPHQPLPSRCPHWQQQ